MNRPALSKLVTRFGVGEEEKEKADRGKRERRERERKKLSREDLIDKENLLPMISISAEFVTPFHDLAQVSLFKLYIPDPFKSLLRSNNASILSLFFFHEI